MKNYLKGKKEILTFGLGVAAAATWTFCPYIAVAEVLSALAAYKVAKTEKWSKGFRAFASIIMAIVIITIAIAIHLNVCDKDIEVASEPQYSEDGEKAPSENSEEQNEISGENNTPESTTPATGLVGAGSSTRFIRCRSIR